MLIIIQNKTCKNNIRMRGDKMTNEEIKIDNINKASDNFKNIIKDVKNQKFQYLDDWLYKKSKIYLKENVKKINNIYPRFDYGTILKVDFGINDGSELSGPHFAISLERYDSTKNPVITILPLSSQNKRHYLHLNELIAEEFTKRLKKHLEILKKEVSDNTNTPMDEIDIKSNEIKLLYKMINYYSKYVKSSFACINLITTISKNKIIKPKNKYDIIGRAKCSSKTMKIISNEIIKKFTNVHIE